GRWDRDPPPRRGRRAAQRPRADRSRGDRGPGRQRGRRLGALRGALSRERGAGAADPAEATRPADAALAAAAEGAVPPPGRAQVSGLPGHPRDLSRMPAGRLRPAVAEAAAAGPALAAARPRRRRNTVGLALFGLAALRLRGDLHVRRRHASRRAAGPGAVARPRAAAGAARPGRAPRTA